MSKFNYGDVVLRNKVSTSTDRYDTVTDVGHLGVILGTTKHYAIIDDGYLDPQWGVGAFTTIPIQDLELVEACDAQA